MKALCHLTRREYATRVTGMGQPADTTRRVTVSLPMETEEWLREHAWRTRRSISETVRDMIESVRKEVDTPYTRSLADDSTVREQL